jgi:hypothetical protein
MAEESVAQMEVEPVAVASLEEAPVKKTRGRKKKETPVVEAIPEPVAVPEPEPVVMPVVEPVVEKPKPKRKPRTAKVNTTVVDVVPIDTPQVEAQQPEEPESYNQVVAEEPRVEDPVKTWQEMQQLQRSMRKQEKTHRYKRMLEGKL